MKVTYDTPEDFNAGVIYFVAGGLRFNADFTNLTITFTGGY
jgi:hypothetical protein